MTYLIWSEEHQAWWKPAAAGYTRSILQAGRYSKADADTICATANQYLPKGSFHEIAFPLPLALSKEPTQTFHPNHSP